MQEREYIDLKFKGLKELITSEFKNLNEKVDKINGQVKTHDRVITEALTERATNRADQHHYFDCVEELSKRMAAVERIEIQHVQNCPINPKFEKLDKTVNTLVNHSAFKKNTRVFWISIFALIISSVSVMAMIYFNLNK